MKHPKKMKTLILDIIDKDENRCTAEENLEELQQLIIAAGGITIEKIIQKRGRPSAKTFLGTGKIEEAAQFVKENEIELIIINGMLKPNQYLHLQKVFPKKKLWDRVDLILKIFDRHAVSRLAQLQIKLAKLQHEIPKLYARHATTLFERAGAGIGTRGLGEKGIEAEKRHIRRQIKQLEEKIQALQIVQKNQRKHRKRTGILTAALVGYTNAGKSSLMKVLTKNKDIEVNDALFVTLDTKIGKTWLPTAEQEILVADTIGFIRDLPPDLISSFLATLEEAQEAHLLLHVIDASDPQCTEKIKIVETILDQIGCQEIPRLYIFNKIDRLQKPKKFSTFRKKKVFVSCVSRKGIEELKEELGKFLLKK